MAYVKIIWEALKILPALYEEVKAFNMARVSKEMEAMRAEINDLTKQLEKASTHEDRKRIVANLNKL